MPLKSALGIVHEGEELRWLAVTRGGAAVQACGQLQTASADGTAAAQQLLPALETQRLTRLPACLGAPPDAMTSRRVTLPAVPREKQRQMVSLEIVDDLPFPAGSAVFDLVPIDVASAGMEELMLLAAHDDSIAAVESWAAEARLRQPEVAPLCCADAAAAHRLLGPTEDGAARLLLDLRQRVSVFTVCAQGQPLYVRSAPLGVADLNAAWAEQTRRPAEADELRQREGFASLREGGTPPAAAWLQSLLSEVRASLLEYAALGPSRRPTSAVLMGAGATTNALSDALTEALGLPVVLAPAPAEFDGDARDFAPYVTAYGLALHRLRPADQRLVLRSQQRTGEQHLTRQRHQRMALSLAGVTALLVALGVGALAWQQDRSNRDLLRQEIRTLHKIEGEQATRQAQQTTLTAYVALQTAARSQRPWLGVLAAVSEAQPEQVWLTSLSARRGQALRLEGRSLTNVAVAEFADRLGQQPLLEAVNIEFSRAAQIQQKRVIEFGLLCKLSTPETPADDANEKDAASGT